MQSENLIASLIAQTTQNIKEVEQLKTLDLHTLTWKKSQESWCILECVEHLNLYGEFYLPEIARQIAAANPQTDLEFKSGFLGNYFASSMLPKEKLNKMKTFKDKNPLNAQLDKTALDKFIDQQLQLLDLLNQSKNVSLNKVKIKTIISSLIKLKLGDVFQFLVNHILRHFSQIERVKAETQQAV